VSTKSGSKTSMNSFTYFGRRIESSRYWYGRQWTRVFMRVLGLRWKADILNTNWDSSLVCCFSLEQQSLPDIYAIFYQLLSICWKAICNLKSQGVPVIMSHRVYLSVLAVKFITLVRPHCMWRTILYSLVYLPVSNYWVVWLIQLSFLLV